jgi:Sulfotransferase family
MAQSNNASIFIVGMNGSGTTMLADSLGRHPDLYMFPRESKVLPFFIANIGRYGDLSLPSNRRRLADSIGRTKPYWQANKKSPLILDDSELEGCDSIGDVVDRIYRHLATRAGKIRWGEKSPMNVQHIRALSQHFPDAGFIHIIRDGRDAAQSFHRRWGFSPVHTIWRWKQVVRDGRSQGAAVGIDRYLEVRYETLTSEPESEMRRICRFAGLSFDPVILGSSMRFMDPRNQSASSGRIVQNSEKWRTYFGAQELAALEDLAGSTLADLGYPVQRAGDAELTLSQRRLLWLRDGLARTHYFFRQHGFRALPRFLRIVSASRKQRSASRY